MDLINEIESIEEDLLSKKSSGEIELEFEGSQINEKKDELQDTTGEIQKEHPRKILKPEEQIKKSRFKKRIEKPEKIKKKFFKFRKTTPDGQELSTDLQDQIESKKGEIKSVKATFTLKLTEQGDLVGLNIKKPKSPREEKKSGLKQLLKRKKSEETVKEKEPPKGIKGNLLGIVSKIKPKKSTGEKSSGGSKISNIVGKIKGIFSRKSK